MWVWTGGGGCLLTWSQSTMAMVPYKFPFPRSVGQGSLIRWTKKHQGHLPFAIAVGQRYQGIVPNSNSVLTGTYYWHITNMASHDLAQLHHSQSLWLACLLRHSHPKLVWCQCFWLSCASTLPEVAFTAATIHEHHTDGVLIHYAPSSTAPRGSSIGWCHLPISQILGFWVTSCGVKMMSICHGWGCQTPQTAFCIHLTLDILV